MGNKLSLAPQKTEAVLLPSKKRTETVVLDIDGHEICTTPTIKYLGLVLDAIISLLPQTNAVCDKNGRVYAPLVPIIANIRGPNQRRRLMLGKAALAVIMYAAPRWWNSLRNLR